MLRILFVIFLSWLCVEVYGQAVEVPKSTDIVVIRGKNYYLHTVQPGQTLFSICKAYGIALEEVKKLNDKADNNLSLYEVLKIPFAEPVVRKDGKYYYHTVGKGETIYSISRRYNIKPKRLLKHNSEYSHNEPLSVGAIVRIPLNEVDPMLLKQEMEKQIDMQQPVEVAEETVPEVEEQVKDTLPVPVREEIFKTEEREVPTYVSEVIMPADPFVKVALLLPFSAKDYPAYIDSMEFMQPITISPRSEQFLGFYEGVLLAVDSLKNRGYKIDLHVYDTERNSDKMYEISEQVNRLRPDMIIGPVYGSVYKAMADYLENKGIPMVYPLSSRSESFGEYPNFIQVNASFNVMADQIAKWLSRQSAEANLIHISLAGTDDSDYSEKLYLKEQVKKIEGVHFFRWNADRLPLDSLRTMLLPDRENILVLPASREADVSKILPLLSALTDGYRITVVGLPEWQTFTSVDHETYYKLNTKIFTYSYIDYTSEAAIALGEKYRKYFHTEPSSLVYKAFDMGLYFIELAAKYRDRALDAIEYYDQSESFSQFRFEKMENRVGKENHGFFIVTFGSDYRLNIEKTE